MFKGIAAILIAPPTNPWSPFNGPDPDIAAAAPVDDKEFFCQLSSVLDGGVQKTRIHLNLNRYHDYLLLKKHRFRRPQPLLLTTLRLWWYQLLL